MKSQAVYRSAPALTCPWALPCFPARLPQVLARASGQRSHSSLPPACVCCQAQLQLPHCCVSLVPSMLQLGLSLRLAKSRSFQCSGNDTSVSWCVCPKLSSKLSESLPREKLQDFKSCHCRENDGHGTQGEKGGGKLGM